MRPPKKVAKVMRPHLPRKPRQDAGMKHVIISEHQRNKKLIDHMVKLFSISTLTFVESQKKYYLYNLWIR